MTRRLRMILLMILAVMLCVVFSMPSFAFEADESVLEAEPEEATVTEPAPEPTVTISAPVEIAVIPDDDWGSVGQEQIASITPAITTENVSEGNAEPDETPAPAETPADVPETAPDMPESVVADPLPDVEKTIDEVQPAEEIPAGDTVAEEPDETGMNDQPETEESLLADQPDSEEPVAEDQTAADEALPADQSDSEETAEEDLQADQPASDEPEAEEKSAEEDSLPADQPKTEETVPDTAEEEIPDEEYPEEETEDTIPEPEAASVTVTVEVSMIDETVMRLLAVVNDPEGRDFLYQWQVSEDSGMTYMDIPEATTDELKVELTDENISDMWRVRVQAI